MPDNNHDIGLENAILRTLSYFDIFSYPLNTSEILNFLPERASLYELEKALHQLMVENEITQVGDLYSLQSDDKLFTRRRNGNALADSLFPRVRKKAHLIFKFPFVRAVMASGSFSKNFMDEHSDFDFFIVCAPNRVWISRMLLVIYKKIFLKNSHRHFCVNYFIDETHLEIDEKNIFTATELATVVPLTGPTQYDRLMNSNHSWLTKYFPNYQQRIVSGRDDQHPTFKKGLEKFIDLTIGDLLNRIFKKITLDRWIKAYSHLYTPSDFRLAFKSTDSVSKNHPRNFQKKVLDEFHLRTNRVTKRIEAYE